MKVILVNGSPREKGCTYTALCEEVLFSQRQKVVLTLAIRSVMSSTSFSYVLLRLRLLSALREQHLLAERCISTSLFPRTSVYQYYFHVLSSILADFLPSILCHFPCDRTLMKYKVLPALGGSELLH